MGNMAHCRFENTLGDLRDCLEHLDDPTDELNEYEQKARTKLLILCQRIANDFEDEIEELLSKKD